MSKSAFAKPNNDARMSLFYFTITSSFWPLDKAAQQKKKIRPSKPQIIKDSTQYKDRAAERRKGINPQEYENDDDEDDREAFLDKSGMTPASSSQISRYKLWK
jgi:hypothetical protein